VPEERDSFPQFINTVPERLPPKKLFEACLEEEKTIETTLFRERVDLLLRHVLFLHPLFESSPLAGYKPFEKIAQERYPFNFSIAPPVRLHVSEREWRYRKLLEYLEKQRDTDLRWLLIARWLQQEEISGPEQFLPAGVLRRLVKRFQKHLPTISPTDLLHAARVKLWLPYFERLRADYNAKKPHNPGLILGGVGYDAEAIEAITRTQSNDWAACKWLGKRKNINPYNLRNAYSRVWGHRRTKKKR